MRKWLFLLIGCLPFVSLAWDLPGHMVVAQIAYERMSPPVEAKVDALSKRIFDQLPLEKQDYLDHRGDGVSTFAKLAPLPDSWLSLPLAQVARRFHAPLPPALQPYAKEKTALWHFSNLSFENSYCRLLRRRNVVWAIETLKKAYAQTDNPNTQALILVFMAHFVGDAHQPLHVITNANWLCQGDAGGNAFCIQRNANGLCVMNLHKLWDMAMGYLMDGNPNLLMISGDLMRRYPYVALKDRVADLDPYRWASREFRYAPFIYNTPRDQMPSPAYRKEGLKITQQQLTLAGYRLAKIITSLVAAHPQSE